MKTTPTFATILCLALVPTLPAQITGEIRGSVIDPSGAAVTQATVRLKSQETGYARTQQVTADGGFAFQLLAIGKYQVSAEAPGFRVSMTVAEVKTGEIASVRLSLEVGQVTETVTISDAVTQLDTENAQIQISITGDAIQQIPVGRDANLFAATAPGVAPVSANNPFLGSGSFNSNGGRGRGNNIVVDGITSTDVSVTGTGGTLRPLNFASIKEVKVITNNFSAEYGRNSSSQVLYITQNGTNELHGQLFEVFQNDKLNARPFFDRSGRTNIVRDNAWGYAVGGPVYIPRLFDGRNKLFWFNDYEGNKIRGAGAARIARVPTPAMLAQVTDPTSRALLDQYQLPSDPSGTLQQNAPSTTNSYKLAFRGDVNIGSRDTLWARYSQSPSESNSSGLTFIASNLAGFGASSVSLARQATLQETHVFGATAVNEFRFGFGRNDPAFPINTPYPIGPRIQFTNAVVERFGVWDGLPQGRSQNTYQFTNNFSFIHGRHNFKTGFEYYYLEADSFFDATQRPLITFADWNDFAAGRPSNFAQRFGSSVRSNRLSNQFAFFQDDWKLNRALTLNLGVRMERANGPEESNGLLSNLNLDSRASIGVAGSGPLGALEVVERSFQGNTNWAPRAGFSWSPGGAQKTVIRGGYGIAYDFIFLNPITNQRFLPPFIVTGTLAGQANFTGNNSFNRIVAGTAEIQAQTRAQAGSIATNVVNFGNVSPAIDSSLRNPQVHQWNLGVQRETAGMVFKASYVGTKGNFLQRTQRLNTIASLPAPASSLADETARLADFRAAFAGSAGNATRRSNRLDGRYNLINYVTGAANSNYHGLQLEAQKRMSHYMINVNYTWAHSIDDGSDALGVLVNDSATAQNPNNNRLDRGHSQFDLRHRFVITHSWDMPWFRDSSHAAVRHVLGGWGFTGITSFRSGFPVTFISPARRGVNTDTMLDGAIRPNAAGAVNLNPVPNGSSGSPFGTTNPDGAQALSTYALSLGLTQPLLGNFGSIGRGSNFLNGERMFNWAFGKKFTVAEGAFFQFRAEFSNLFNNTSFQDLDRNIGSTRFGNYLTTGPDQREIILNLRFVF